MTKKRTKLEVTKDLLEILGKGRKVKKTHLIYKANLSNNSIKPYLDGIIKNGLIVEVKENGKNIFMISEKGVAFLEEFNKIKIFTDAYGLGY